MGECDPNDELGGHVTISMSIRTVTAMKFEGALEVAIRVRNQHRDNEQGERRPDAAFGDPSISRCLRRPTLAPAFL